MTVLDPGVVYDCDVVGALGIFELWRQEGITRYEVYPNTGILGCLHPISSKILYRPATNRDLHVLQRRGHLIRVAGLGATDRLTLSINYMRPLGSLDLIPHTLLQAGKQIPPRNYLQGPGARLAFIRNFKP